MTADRSPRLGAPPPPDGLRAALLAARRRRLRAAGACLSVPTAVVMLAVSLPQANNSGALVPISPRPGDPAPTSPPTTVTPPPRASATPEPLSPAAAPTPPGTPAPTSTVVPPSPSATKQPRQQPSSAPMQRDSVPSSPPLCGSAAPDPPQWCANVSVESGRAFTLTLTVCPTATNTDRQLTYATSIETDFVVLTEAGREVWRWSAGTVSRRRPHQVTVETWTCARWRTTWTARTGSGRQLPAGTYRLRGSSTADELRGVRVAEETFPVG